MKWDTRMKTLFSFSPSGKEWSNGKGSGVSCAKFHLGDARFFLMELFNHKSFFFSLYFPLFQIRLFLIEYIPIQSFSSKSNSLYTLDEYSNKSWRRYWQRNRRGSAVCKLTFSTFFLSARTFCPGTEPKF